MVFKLVRTDTAEPFKIQLPVGKHLIGRGKLLDCEDKRVSRNHGELEVIDDKVVIKALHQNPCFVIRKGTEDTQLIKQNSSLDISNGDKFGLLPDSYWYELLHCTDIDSETNIQQEPVETVDQQENNEDMDSAETQPTNGGGGDGDSNDNSQVLDLNLNETIENNIPGSPSLIDAEKPGSQATQEYPTDQSPHKNPSHDEQDPNIKIEDAQSQIYEPNSPSKRGHSTDDDDSDAVKRIKKEPEVKPDPDGAQAGPSNNQAGSDSSDKDKDQKQTPQPNPMLRERCMYGANCYRRNPQHKAQFSHPTDPDWGTGAQAVCPYGASCRKMDARHWRDHSHPPGVLPPSPQQAHPPPNHAGKKRRKPKPKKRQSSDEDNEQDSPSPGLIVQGKRARKTVKRTDNWSGSESENEDPFGTDESDEWQPSSDVTDSQLYSQDI